MELSSKQEWWKSSANISAMNSKDYAIQQGLLVKTTRDPIDEMVTNVSVTLTPSLFSRELFDLACFIAANLNSLVDRVSGDKLFMENALQRYLPWVFKMFCRDMITLHSTYDTRAFYVELGSGTPREAKLNFP
jgi:hypothetical protein